VRKRIVSAVLATDMSKHFAELEKFKLLVSNQAFLEGPKKEDDKIFIMSMALHSSDISNPSKQWLF
jgi:hypothetical protein